MTRAEIAAAKGAAWLDKVHPEWWTKVDLSTLDLGRARRCVLGQVVGTHEGVSGFGRVFDNFNPFLRGDEDIKWFTSHGFLAVSIGPVDALDEAWITEIKARAETGNIT